MIDITVTHPSVVNTPIAKLERDMKSISCSKTLFFRVATLIYVLLFILTTACSKTDTYQEGVALYDAKNYQGAIPLFKNAISDDPSGSNADDAYLYLAKAEYWTNDFTSASTDLNTLITNFPDSPLIAEAYYWKGKTLVQQNMFSEARAAFQEVISNYSDSSLVDDSAYSIAKSYYDAADYATAVTELNAFITNNSSSSRLDNAQYYIAKSYHDQKMYSEAIAAFELLITTYPTSSWADNSQYQIGKVHFDSAVDANQVAVSSNLAADTTLFQTAITAFQKLITDNPGSSSADNAQIYIGKSYQEIADITKNKSDYDAAIVAFALVNATNYPGSTSLDNAIYETGKTHYSYAGDMNAAAAAAGQPEDDKLYLPAISSFASLLADYSTSSYADNAQLYIGKSYRGIADITLAATDYEKAIGEFAKLNSTNYPTSTNLDNALYETGKAYYAQGMYDQAIVEFDKVITGYPDGSSADNALYYKGHSYRRNSTPDYALARSTYALVITNYPTSSYADNAQYYIGYTYHLENDCVNETTEMQKVVDTYPTSSYASTAQTHIDDIVAAAHTCI